MARPTQRTIVESDLFRASKETLPVTCERLDEILDGILWVLRRRPEFFPNIPGTTLYRAKTEQFPDLPVFIVWFRFNENTVTLELIEHWTPDE